MEVRKYSLKVEKMFNLICRDIQRDGGNGKFVEINTELAEHYGIVNGSPVKISGRKNTVAVVRCQQDLPRDVIAMGSTIRINAKVREGDDVEVTKISAAPLEAAVICPVSRDLTEAEMEKLGTIQFDDYVSKLDHFISYLNNEPIEFQIMKCKPAHGWLTPIQIVRFLVRSLERRPLKSRQSLLKTSAALMIQLKISKKSLLSP